MFWCPETLLDLSNLENYYRQIYIENAIQQVKLNPTGTWGFPNAIYINAVDVDGTIRTGTQVLWGANRNTVDTVHQTTSYAYVDTFILYNVYIGCVNNVLTASCNLLKDTLEQRRAKHPLTRWDDTIYGRSSTWPESAM